MRIGYGLLDGQRAPESNKTFSQIYSEELEIARLAERSNFYSVCLTEHHFTATGWWPSCLPMACAIAAITSRIQIYTDIAISSFYDPIRLAEDAATIELVSKGRFHLGLGVGYRPEEFRVFGVPLSQRAKRQEEVVEILRRAWTRERFSFDGEIFQYNDVLLMPKPELIPPIVIGTAVRAGIKRAARIGDGILLASSHTLEEIRDLIAYYRACLGELGRDGSRLESTIHRWCHVAEKHAWETMRVPFLDMQERYFRQYSESGYYHGALYSQEFDPTEETKYRSNVIVGTPAECIEQLEVYRREFGDDIHVVARMDYPAMSFEDKASSIELMGQQVIPHFEKR